MANQDTLILVVVIGSISAILVLFIVTVTGALQPSPSIIRARHDDVKLDFDATGTAIVTLQEGQKSGPVIVTYIEPYNAVTTAILTPTPATIEIVQVALYVGDDTNTCAYQEIRLLNVSADTATFKLVRGGGCPYCWHMYNPET